MAVAWRENGKAYHFGLPDDGSKSVMPSDGGGMAQSMPGWSEKVWLGWEVAA